MTTKLPEGEEREPKIAERSRARTLAAHLTKKVRRFGVEQGVVRQSFKHTRSPTPARTDRTPRANRDTGAIRARGHLTETAAVGGRPAVATVLEPAADGALTPSKAAKGA